jgi:hypothetical protein
MPHSQGSRIIPTLSRINPIPHNDTYLFKVHSNVPLPSTSRRTLQVYLFTFSESQFMNLKSHFCKGNMDNWLTYWTSSDANNIIQYSLQLLLNDI